MLDGSPEPVPIDEDPNYQIVHLLCFGKTDRPTRQPLAPSPQVGMFALDLLRIILAHSVLLRLHVTLVGIPDVRTIARDAKGLKQPFQLQTNLILT